MYKELELLVNYLIYSITMSLNVQSFRLEEAVNSTERTRDSTGKRYKDFQIPWEWMLDAGLIGQVGD